MSNVALIAVDAPVAAVAPIVLGLDDVVRSTQSPGDVGVLLTQERAVGATWNGVDSCTDITVYDPTGSGLAKIVFDALQGRTGFGIQWFDEDTTELVAERTTSE